VSASTQFLADTAVTLIYNMIAVKGLATMYLLGLWPSQLATAESRRFAKGPHSHKWHHLGSLFQFGECC